MERNIKIEAITLKKLKIGDNNVGVTILTESDEVLFIMAFGAVKPKNKLFSGTMPFAVSKWDLYYDPVKEFYRAKEVDVTQFNQDIQLSIENFYTASLFNEIILKTQGSEGVFLLLKQALYCLQYAKNHRTVIIQFILRLFETGGLLPSFTHCAKCEKDIIKESLYYNGQDELLCFRCVTGPKIYEINPGMAVYCQKTVSMPMDKAIKIGLEENSIKELKSYFLQLIKVYCGGKLLTLNSSDGLI
ncbi:MAG: DNA repair protein RecO [Spirochaetaceae bacterium]